MISIIIPTLNEEKFLPVLLKSIKKQCFMNDIEIIVADADSKDKTVKIAKSYGCKIVRGGLPAKGRNEGAKIAKGNLLLFLDADGILPNDFLQKAQREFEERELDIASFCLKPQTDKRLEVFLMNILYNWTVLLAFEKIIPHASSQAILVKKSIHEKIGGFDEEIKIGEDHIYARRAQKFGRFGVLRSTKIISSLRRYKKDSLMKTYLKYILVETYMLLIGGVKKDFFEYKFAHY